MHLANEPPGQLLLELNHIASMVVECDDYERPTNNAGVY